MAILNTVNLVYKELFTSNLQDETKSLDAAREEHLGTKLLIIIVLSLIYGLTMGSNHSLLQGVVSGLKLVLLFFTSIAICFPTIYIMQKVFGSNLTMRQIVIIISNGMLLMTTILAAFIPIVLFFQITGSKYHFLQLLHVAIFIFSGILGLKYIYQSLRNEIEKASLYPKLGNKVFKIWLLIFMFVSVQLSWNLRPFLSKKEEPFTVIGKYKGNFYTAIIYSFEQLFSSKGPTDSKMYLYSSDSSALQTGIADTSNQK